MDRRQFLAVAACAPLASAPSEPMYRLGFSLYGMKSLRTEDALQSLVKIGYSSAELCLLPGYDADSMKLTKERCQSFAKIPLPITALMENLTLADAKQDPQRERLKRAAEVAHWLPNRPLIETVLGGGNWEQVKESFRDRLASWAEIAKSANVTLAIKPHRFGAVHHPEQALWLLNQIKNDHLRLTFDWSHLIHREFDMVKIIRQLAPHTAFVHIKDTVIVDGKAVFQLPGQSGQIDYETMLSELWKANYRGDICCEVSGMVSGKADYDPVKAAQQCYNNLAAAFRRRVPM